jgi:hypothetical protein
MVVAERVDTAPGGGVVVDISLVGWARTQVVTLAGGEWWREVQCHGWTRCQSLEMLSQDDTLYFTQHGTRTRHQHALIHNRNESTQASIGF